MRRLSALLTVLICHAAVTMTACGRTHAIRVDGSSTVTPITEAVADAFQHSYQPTKLAINVSGTVAGLRRLCDGVVDIAGASRKIRNDEVSRCSKNHIEPIELMVAFDGVVVGVHPSNTFVTSLTLDELRKIWEPAAQGVITRWNQIRPEWPNRDIHLYGPGVMSGTYDYFTEVVVQEHHASRGDYVSSSDYNLVAQRISSDPDALGYLGFGYYAQNSTAVRAIAIAASNNNQDSPEKNQPIMPSAQTISDGQYALSRPVFLYVSRTALPRQDIRDFVRFYLTNESLVSAAGGVPLPSATQQQVLTYWEGQLLPFSLNARRIFASAMASIWRTRSRVRFMTAANCPSDCSSCATSRAHVCGNESMSTSPKFSLIDPLTSLTSR